MRSEEIRAIHDLRMPAQMMTGCAEMLKCVLGEDNPEARRYVDLLVQSGAELVSLLDQLMEAGRRAADEPRAYLTVGDMAAVTSSLCGLAEPYARTRGLTLICVRPPYPVVTAFDSERYSRILMNLLSNAMKFTPSGGSRTRARSGCPSRIRASACRIRSCSRCSRTRAQAAWGCPSCRSTPSSTAGMPTPRATCAAACASPWCSR